MRGHMRHMKFEKVSDGIWEFKEEGMNVPARVFASEKLLGGIEEGVTKQVKNVAMLPGIQKASMVMPDAHYGYGFPIGGVAATNLDEGVISPGGVGYDINCGVRLATTNLEYNSIKDKIENLISRLFAAIPHSSPKSSSAPL